MVTAVPLCSQQCRLGGVPMVQHAMRGWVLRLLQLAPQPIRKWLPAHAGGRLSAKIC